MFSLNRSNQWNYDLILNIIYNEDEFSDNNREYFQFTVYPPANSYNDLVINEIMYAPSNDQPEWIEIYNKSATSINLNNWSFSDAVSRIKITKEDKILEPGNYLIISKDSSIFDFYSFPFKAVITSLPSLNNSGDAAVVKNSAGILIDSIYYSPSWGGNFNGKSLERISVSSQSNDEENWKTSESIFNGTPGRINSVSRKNYDLSVTVIKTSEAFVITGEQFQFDLKIKNIGLNPSEKYTAKIFNDADKDSIPKNNELIKQVFCNSIEPEDSITLNLNITDIVKGENYFIVSIETEMDDNMENNISYFEINGIEINEVRNDIVINEIMYEPSNSEPEWIELYNRSNNY